MDDRFFKYNEIIALLVAGKVLYDVDAHEFVKMDLSDYFLLCLSLDNNEGFWEVLDVADFCFCNMETQVYRVLSQRAAIKLMRDLKKRLRRENER